MRLFAALSLPDTIGHYLAGLEGGIEGARWQTAAQMHITLRFIGEVDGAMARDIAQNLVQVTAPCFEISLDEIGLFGKLDAPRALWVSVRPKHPLQHLHDKIDRVLISTGLAPDKRKFMPHITLARFGRPGRQTSSSRKHGRVPKGLENFLAGPASFIGPVSETFPVEEFVLYESHLGRDGADYQAVACYPLTSRLSASQSPE